MDLVVKHIHAFVVGCQWKNLDKQPQEMYNANSPF